MDSELGACKLKAGRRLFESCNHAVLSGEELWGGVVPIRVELGSLAGLPHVQKNTDIPLSNVVSTLSCYYSIVVASFPPDS